MFSRQKEQYEHLSGHTYILELLFLGSLFLFHFFPVTPPSGERTNTVCVSISLLRLCLEKRATYFAVVTGAEIHPGSCFKVILNIFAELIGSLRALSSTGALHWVYVHYLRMLAGHFLKACLSSIGPYAQSFSLITIPHLLLLVLAHKVHLSNVWYVEKGFNESSPGRNSITQDSRSTKHFE